MKSVLTFGLLIFGLGLVFSGCATQGPTLKTPAGNLWTSPDGLFSCYFPLGFSTPQLKSQSVYRTDISERIWLSMYMATKTPHVAMISFWKLHPKLRALKGTDQAILQDSKAGSVQRIDAKLLSEHSFKLGKWNGLEYTGRTGTMYLRTKLLIYRETMIYMNVIYVNDGEAIHSSEANAFFKSLQVR